MERSAQQDQLEQPMEDGVQEDSQQEMESGELKDAVKQNMPFEDKETLRKENIPIILYIGNYIENSGTICGDIAQSQIGIDELQNRALHSSRFVDKKSIPDFFAERHSSAQFAAVIALAELGSIPENRFFQVAGRLEQCIFSSELASQDKEGERQFRFRTIEETLAPFQVRKNLIEISYGSERHTVTCVSFASRKIEMQVRNFVWSSYPYFRPVLAQWMIELIKNRGNVLDHILMSRAVNALAVNGAADIGYTFRELIPMLEENFATQSGVKYLTAFIEYLMKESACRGSVDELLLRWCRRRDPCLWQVPYCLYGKEGEWRFQDEVPISLSEQLEKDAGGKNLSYLKWYRSNRGYLLIPAHGDERVATLLIEQVVDLFAHCKHVQERNQFGIYFLSLFRWDYLTDFSNTPGMIFLRGLGQKELREKILPLFQYAWRRSLLRSVMIEILACHFREINQFNASWEYLKKPFLFLAFTGKKFDYDNTYDALKKCARMQEAAPVAEGLMTFLSNELEARCRKCAD